MPTALIVFLGQCLEDIGDHVPLFGRQGVILFQQGFDTRLKRFERGSRLLDFQLVSFPRVRFNGSLNRLATVAGFSGNLSHPLVVEAVGPAYTLAFFLGKHNMRSSRYEGSIACRKHTRAQEQMQPYSR